MANNGVYSIWLTAEGETGERLREIVKTMGEAYGAPAFEPHITIVPDFEGELEVIAEKVRQGMEGLETSLELTFEGPEVGQTYYRSVYLLAKMTPVLEAVFGRVRQALGVTNLDLFPHLSLIYGKFEVAKRAEIARLAQKHLLEAGMWPLGFCASKVTLFETAAFAEDDDRVRHWRKALEVEF
jgi:hypothetical protein